MKGTDKPAKLDTRHEQNTLITSALFLTSTAIADPKLDVRFYEIAFSQSVENKDIEAFKFHPKRSLKR